jgi:hypothetical protein
MLLTSARITPCQCHPFDVWYAASLDRQHAHTLTWFCSKAAKRSPEWLPCLCGKALARLQLVTGLTAPTLIPNRSRTAVPWFGPDEAGRPSRPDACGDQETDLACAQVQKCDVSSRRNPAVADEFRLPGVAQCRRAPSGCGSVI